MTDPLSLVVASLAWGALAFGANYPWAYWPLIAAAGASGLRLASASRGPAPVLTLIALGSVGCAVVVQLLPLTLVALSTVSPAAVIVSRHVDLRFALGPTTHPLSINPVGTRAALCFLVALTLLMTGVARIQSRRDIRRLTGAVLVLGGVLAMVGIIQRATFSGRIYGFWTPMNTIASPFGPFVNKNHFAGWMLMAIPLAFGMLAAAVHTAMPRAATVRDRAVWLFSADASRAALVAFAIFLMGLALVLTRSRSGIVSFVAAAGLAAMLSMRQRTWSRGVILMTLILAVCGLVMGAAGIDLIAQRFNEADTATLGDRLSIWRDTASIAKDFWLTGTGINTYGTATLFYQTDLTLGHLREAHNEYFQLAAEGGLLVGLPIVFAIAAFIRDVRLRFGSGGASSNWIRHGAVTGILAVALQSTVDFSLQMPGNAALFAVLCGIALHSEEKLVPGSSCDYASHPSSRR